MFTFFCGIICCASGGFIAGTGLLNLRDEPAVGILTVLAGVMFITLGFFFVNVSGV